MIYCLQTAKPAVDSYGVSILALVKYDRTARLVPLVSTVTDDSFQRPSKLLPGGPDLRQISRQSDPKAGFRAPRSLGIRNSIRNKLSAGNGLGDHDRRTVFNLLLFAVYSER
jgi:hypothetical protein